MEGGSILLAVCLCVWYEEARIMVASGEVLVKTWERRVSASEGILAHAYYGLGAWIVSRGILKNKVRLGVAPSCIV